MNGNFTFGILWARSAECLRGKWGWAIIVCILGTLAASAGGIFSFLLFPVTVGIMLYFLRLSRYQQADMECLFKPFSQYGRMLWGYFRVLIFVFLQYLLLIIPGIVAGYRYAMTYYIMLDEPGISVKEAMRKSGEMMKGHKFQLFCYSLVLGILSMLAAVFTLGIAMIWLMPFTAAFYANFYLTLRGEAPELMEIPSAERPDDGPEGDNPLEAEQPVEECQPEDPPERD